MSIDKQPRSATIYDFSHPGHKLNKQWPVLDLINDRVAASFGASLSKRLQISLHGKASVSSRVKYTDSVTSLGNTCIVNELMMPPIPGVIWFCMDTSVLATVVDSYFGGEAILTTLDTPRKLSRTEKRVMQHVLDALVLGIADGWSMLTPLKVSQLGEIDISRLANAPMDQVMVSSEIVIHIGAVELPCQLVYPFESLKPFGSLLEHEDKKQSTQDVQFNQELQAGLMDCEVDIRGVLSETPITLGKLLELKTGDFIPLRDVQTVSFKTQNMPLFDARVGSSNGRVSASLSRWHLPVNH